jgi:hypothetical protein
MLLPGLQADANIVVRNIRESHLLLARIVAARGGSVCRLFSIDAMRSERLL